MNNKLSNIEAVAAAKALESVAKTLPKIETGSYNGTVTVSVNYSLSKASDTEQSAAGNILSDAGLAKALLAAKMTPQQEGRFLAALMRTAKTAMRKGVPASDLLIEGDKRILSQIERVKAKVVAKLPRVPRAGATRVVADVTKVEISDLASTAVAEVLGKRVLGRTKQLA